MTSRHAASLTLACALGVLLATTWTAQAEPTPAAAGAYRECAFVRATWHPEHAPPGVPSKFVGLTAVPEGWTPVSGSMGTYPSFLACR